MSPTIKKILIRTGSWAIVIAIIATLVYLRRDEQPPPKEPPTVIVARPSQKDVTKYWDFTGTTEAIEFIEIRARVEGFLETVHFKDSDDVEKDELLFVIDPTEYQARRDEAFAELERAQAELERAQVDLERVEEAVKTNAVSQREVSTRKAQRDKAQASEKAAQAALIQAEYQLSYTQIHSPIAGRTSRKLVDLGNLVGAEEKTLLTTVVKMHPMYVYFNISELILLEVLEGKTPDEKRNPSLPFYVGLANEKGHSREGVIDYIDNTVDPATGTIKVRGKLPNDKDPIYPGMFVRIRVPASVKSDAILVHERAIGTDIAGKYLQIVGKDNIVQQRIIKMGILVDDMRVIEEGIKAEEVYIVDGTQQGRPGLPVNTQWLKKEKDDTKKSEQGGKL